MKFSALSLATILASASAFAPATSVSLPLRFYGRAISKKNE